MSIEDADEVAVALNKKFGPGSSFFLGSFQGERVATIPTGLIWLNSVIGGGVPRGKIVQVYGPEASGKTTLALHIIKSAQGKGEICGFIDAEHAFNIDLAANMGINLDKLMFSQPDVGEEALDIVLAWIQSGAFSVIAVDSVAALTPRAEIEGEMDDQQVGAMARMMGKGLRKINGAASKHDVCVIFVNQLRMKVGVMYGNPEVTPGGKALSFWSSMNLDLRAYKHIKDGKRTIGREGKITCTKNKIAAPFGVVQTRLYYGKGFDPVFDMMEFGLELGAVEKNGNTISVGSYKLGVGNNAAYAALRGSAKARKKVRIAIKKSLEE